MSKKKFTKLLALYLPYVVIGLLATNLGEAWRLTTGKELGDKILSLMSTVPAAFANPLPSLYPFDLFVGLCCGAGMRLAVYLKGKNAKKYRHGMEYGSARWGTAKDIEPFMAPKFEDNIILTKTERLMMSNRPADPKNARNKNVLIVGGSGSGKTRFWLKPNLLQCHSSYVVTDPKGSIVVECGNALLKKGYKLKIFNTINFSKSMHYNPMSYIHSEKDILKLVTALMTNTKGEGSGGDPFWEKSERLLLTALIAYLHNDQWKRYEIFQDTLGGRPYLFNGGLPPGGSDGSGTPGIDYQIPAEALTDSEFAAIYKEAQKYVGTPYVWGGSTPETGFDCSGYVCWVYNQNGYDVGRTTANGLWNKSQHISEAEAKPGDLVFFKGTYDTPGMSHTGIYLGNGMMVSAGDPIKYANIHSSYWEKHLAGFGRLSK